MRRLVAGLRWAYWSASTRSVCLLRGGVLNRFTAGCECAYRRCHLAGAGLKFTLQINLGTCSAMFFLLVSLATSWLSLLSSADTHLAACAVLSQAIYARVGIAASVVSASGHQEQLLNEGRQVHGFGS
jgi:hypothetical protein